MKLQPPFRTNQLWSIQVGMHPLRSKRTKMVQVKMVVPSARLVKIRRIGRQADRVQENRQQLQVHLIHRIK